MLFLTGGKHTWALLGSCHVANSKQQEVQSGGKGWELASTDPTCLSKTRVVECCFKIVIYHFLKITVKVVSSQFNIFYSNVEHMEYFLKYISMILIVYRYVSVIFKTL